ncbi:MAG: hypothetical protein IH595_10755 [Bacteroidales bacterium]|nr:hypothetical protein [Bacteroidales bacterium]
MNPSQKRTYLLVFIFSIAMGFLEAVVVVYLRKIFYPNGFDFPLVILPPKMYFTELFREAATIIMLITLALIAGKSRLEKFAYFLVAFAVWDIVYYAGLKLLVNWPPTFMTWDILFLIPIPWVSPVLAPIISALSMIALAFGLTHGQQKIHAFRLKWIEWEVLIVGACIVFASFTWEYAYFLLSIGVPGTPRTQISAILARFFPGTFPWSLFILGEVLIIITIVMIWRRSLAGNEN